MRQRREHNIQWATPYVFFIIVSVCLLTRVRTHTLLLMCSYSCTHTRVNVFVFMYVQYVLIYTRACTLIHLSSHTLTILSSSVMTSVARCLKRKSSTIILKVHAKSQAGLLPEGRSDENEKKWKS